MNSQNAAIPVQRTWEELKERLHYIFTAITDSDLDFAESKKEEMIQKLQVRLGKTREELIAIFEII